MKLSDRYLNLPPYLFAGLEKKSAEMRAAGVDLIDLGIGDPDLQPPEFFVQSMKNHIDDPDTHLYPTSKGDPEVRRSLARWFKGRFGIDLNPELEICIIIGAKEGLANFTRALVNPGNKVAAPDPGYPVYAQAGAILNDAKAIPMPLIADDGFIPDLSQIEDCRIVFLNYPNNPTGAPVPDGFFEKVADFADTHSEILIAHDAAYSEMAFGGYKSPSLLQYTRNVIEFHSMSKVFNATGFRIGFAAGREDLIGALAATKSQLDSGAPVFIQRAMAEGLQRYDGPEPPAEIQRNLAEYEIRRVLAEEGLSKLGWEVLRSKATFYVWAKVGDDELRVIDAALEKGVVLTPGRGFGRSGKGYVRLAVCQPYERIEEALERLKTM